MTFRTSIRPSWGWRRAPATLVLAPMLATKHTPSDIYHLTIGVATALLAAVLFLAHLSP